MIAKVSIRVDGDTICVAEETSLAAALVNAGHHGFRRSITGQRRGPLCGMGSCFECRVTVDGVSHRRACLEPVRAGMDVVTDA
jgi:sarcosine oxidase subunit alpha